MYNKLNIRKTHVLLHILLSLPVLIFLAVDYFHKKNNHIIGSFQNILVI
ncbi:hypothetical protein IMSAGC009_00629 [Lachnospiraceae bacterium]|nr:hypothetical protein IMSAGC009_00629 [Lachnospiraceae bacterium]